jgi:cell division protein FtsB
LETEVELLRKKEEVHREENEKLKGRVEELDDVIEWLEDEHEELLDWLDARPTGS